jgi:hypothetical protein
LHESSQPENTVLLPRKLVVVDEEFFQFPGDLPFRDNSSVVSGGNRWETLTPVCCRTFSQARMQFDDCPAHVGYWDGMDAEQTIAEIECLERIFAEPDTRPLSPSDLALLIEDTTECWRIALGFASGSSTGFAAALKLKADFGFSPECRLPGGAKT